MQSYTVSCDHYTRVSIALNMGAIKSKLARRLPIKKYVTFQDNNVKELQPGSLKGLATANSITTLGGVCDPARR